MSSIDFSNYTDAEKIVLAEQLWDSVSKEDIELTDKIISTMKSRLKRIENGEVTFYSREEVRKKIDHLRSQLEE